MLSDVCVMLSSISSPAGGTGFASKCLIVPQPKSGHSSGIAFANLLVDRPENVKIKKIHEIIDKVANKFLSQEKY